MTKKTFSITLLIIAQLSFAKTLSFDFSVSKNFSFPYLQAKSEANKVIFQNAYLAFHKKESQKIKGCWLNYLKNKKLDLEIFESRLENLGVSEENIKFRVFFDPSKIKFSEDHSNFIKKAC
tara:strand:+ start:7053 stop:7415 length:363 start_codon:yes stop_codon:yes gene_type:complete